MKNWDHMEDAFGQINNECNYLILRNFEGFFGDILIEGHNDIDVLCASKRDRKRMVRILDAKPRIGIDNGIHYKFMYKGKEIALDVRTVGDGYYDRSWQSNMLKNRCFNPVGFYTMNLDDYFYSLIYHVIYQKKILSQEYLIRLRKMNPLFHDSDQIDFEKALLQFMVQNHYKYTITYDKYVNLYFNQPLVGLYIQYPTEIKLRHRVERILEYVFGKMNGAKVRLKKLIKYIGDIK